MYYQNGASFFDSPLTGTVKASWTRVDYFEMMDDVSDTVQLDVKPVSVYTSHPDRKHAMMTTLCKSETSHSFMVGGAVSKTERKENVQEPDYETNDSSLRKALVSPHGSTETSTFEELADHHKIDNSHSHHQGPEGGVIPRPIKIEPIDRNVVSLSPVVLGDVERQSNTSDNYMSSLSQPLKSEVPSANYYSEQSTLSLAGEGSLSKPISSSISNCPGTSADDDNTLENTEIPHYEDIYLSDNKTLIAENSDISFYCCRHCPAKFKTKYMLQEHKIMHSGDITSNTAFPKKSSLTMHQATNKNAKIFSCSFCDAKFKMGKDLTAHVRTHNNDKHTDASIAKWANTCTFCNAVFNSRSKLVRHERVHTGEKPFSCSFCGLSFGTKATRKLHEKIHTGEKPFSCPYCNLECRTKSLLNIHIRTHTGEKPYKCELCDARFANRGGYNSHMTVHTDARPFSCSHCEATFKRIVELRQHERTHTGEKPYQCEYCDAKFSQIGNYKVHVRVHTGDKPYRCDKCDARFTTSSGLKYHLSTHLKVKPFQCDICSMAFSVKRGLRSHQRMHTGQLPYACKQCDAVYNSFGSLKNHELTHTGEKPFACDVCHVRFRLKSTLKNHATVHTGIKAFSCRFCDAKLSKSAGLKYHEMIHTGEKPFSCEKCGASFRAKTGLKHHYKSCQSQEKS